jgi:hypothetical protein
MKLHNTLDPLLNECENQEKELMKQFGETDSNEFNYDTCCAIFRQLIEQVEKENKVNLNELKSFLFEIILRNEKNVY